MSNNLANCEWFANVIASGDYPGGNKLRRDPLERNRTLAAGCNRLPRTQIGKTE
jgi:hypothetical protein